MPSRHAMRKYQGGTVKFLASAPVEMGCVLSPRGCCCFLDLPKTLEPRGPCGTTTLYRFTSGMGWVLPIPRNFTGRCCFETEELPAFHPAD